MLTLLADQPDCLWDDALPVEVRELPEDLAALDVLLSDHELLWPLVERWRWEFARTGRAVLTEGRPTIALETFIRLMVLKQRYRWGYRALVAEVSDSIHLRRFCRISLCERVPDESTVRKLTGRIGPEAVAELTRALIVKATREAVFTAGGADRFDGDRGGCEVSDRRGAGVGGGQVAGGGGSQARQAGRRAVAPGAGSLSLDGSPVAGDLAHDPPALGGGEGRGAEADRADGRAVGALGHRGAQARRDRPPQGAGARGEGEAEGGRQARGAGGPLPEGGLPDQAARGAEADHRPDRVALRSGREADSQGQARHAERVWVRLPVGGGDREHQARRSRADRASLHAARDRGENTLLPATVAELDRLGISPREVALDGGFMPGPTNDTLAALEPDQVFIAGRQEPDSKRTTRRLRRYRTGEEGRISHLKRRYGLDRSRLKGSQGHQIWTEWAILAYNADTLAVRTR